MSQRRLLFLVLLVIPAILFYLTLTPANPVQQVSTYEMLSLVIGIPILFLNIWEWQAPETLDPYLKPEIFRNTSLALSYSAGRFILLAIGAVVFLALTAAVFGLGGQANQASPQPNSGETLDVAAIQTAAVKTALAQISPYPGGDQPSPGPTQPGGSANTPTNPLNPAGTPTPEATSDPNLDTPLPESPDPGVLETATNQPTNTAIPSNTPISNRDTPEPTQPGGDTPEPTATKTPEIPDPISLTGSGNSVIDFEKWIGPAVLSATHDGDGDFIVDNYSANNQKIGRLINTAGFYVGSLPLDFSGGTKTTRFDITADGAWELQIIPLDLARGEIVPSTLDGDGDDVIVIIDGDPGQMIIDASQTSDYFILWAFGAGSPVQLVNSEGEYEGTVTAPAGTTSFAVMTIGPWSIEMNAR